MRDRGNFSVVCSPARPCAPLIHHSKRSIRSVQGHAGRAFSSGSADFRRPASHALNTSTRVAQTHVSPVEVGLPPIDPLTRFDIDPSRQHNLCPAFSIAWWSASEQSAESAGPKASPSKSTQQPTAGSSVRIGKQEITKARLSDETRRK